MKKEIEVSDHSANGSHPINSAILTFCLGGQTYGLPITAVNQIIELVAITRIPKVPPGVQGVINVHGCIVPVIDLRQRFNLPFIPYHLHTPLILANVNDRTLALVVDEVEEIIEIHQAASQVNKNRTGTPGLVAETVNVERRLIPLVNVHCLLNKEEQKILNQVLSTTNSSQPSRPKNGDDTSGGVIA